MPRKLILCAIGLILLVSACAVNEFPPPNIGISADRVNHEIELRAPIGWNTFKWDSPVTLEVLNASNDTLVFEYNYGVRIFVQTRDGWTEVKDQLISINTSDVVIRPTQVYPRDKGIISILPATNNVEEDSINVRIFVIGYVLEEDKKTDEVAAAFIDITLRR